MKWYDLENFEQYFTHKEDSESFGVGMKFSWNYTKEEIIKRKGLGKELNLFMAKTCARYFERYVPYRSGRLNNSMRTYSGKDYARIVYTTKYAEKQYEGPDDHWNRYRKIHPLATSHWDRVGWWQHNQTIINKVDAERKRLSRD